MQTKSVLSLDARSLQDMSKHDLNPLSLFATIQEKTMFHVRANAGRCAEDSKPKDKIAAEIRSTPETAQFDLAGYDEQQVGLFQSTAGNGCNVEFLEVKTLVKEAFGTPFDIRNMIRVTFVVGGGKAIRGKYSESLARVLGTALQDSGFNQDSAASCDLMSAGSFKGQHDTQRNLKLVHVFPKVSNGNASPKSRGAETQAETCQRVSTAPWTDFVEEVGPWIRSRDSSKIQALMVLLEELLEELQDTELAFQQGKQVSEPRRRRYDELGSSDEVVERLRWLRNGLESSESSQVVKTSGDVDGATLAFDAPALSTNLQVQAEASPSVPDTEQVDDDVWLQRRLEQTRNESEKLKKELSSNRPLQATRETLPAYAQRSVIQESVQDSPVVVIEGDTGCGKSTQVPQFIFEDWLAKGHAGAANIIMTQPRRISAIGVADRIANEMNTGLGDLVGYSIRLESKRSFRTKILVCTTGVLLRRLENDPQLHNVTHIIVDECHERDLDTDFLLIILRDLLPKRPRLRIVLMSATINAQIFKDYFPGCKSVSIPGRTFPVKSYYLEHALMHTNLVIEPNSEYCRKDIDPVMTYQEEQELRQVYEKAEHLELLGSETPSKHVLQQLHRFDPEKINFDLVAQVVRHIHFQVDACKDGKSPGAILVFVPGLREIKKAIRCICEDAETKGKGRGFEDRGATSNSKGVGKGGPEVTKDGLWVLPLHSMISVNEQRLVFKRPPSRARKVVVTTNIAETSITIDDVEYVVDCGRHKQTKYDPQNRISMLVDCVETKANAKQRRGRAGRVKPGVCYHLVNVRRWRRMEDFEKPEMLRVPLDSLCLRVHGDMALNFQPSEREKGNATELKRESINKAMDFLGPQRKQTISSESLQKAQIQLNETSFTRATSESKITDEALKKSHREDAIQRIQAAQRGIDCRHLASEQQKERAATKIQALERGKQCRQQLAAEQLEKPEQDEKQQQEDAAMKIQKVQRGNASRKLDQEKKHAATKIQALERGRQCRQQLAAEQLDKPAEQDEKQQQEDAAMKIQKVQRGNASRKLDQEKKHAATKIQALERGRQCRQQLAAEQLDKQQQEEAAIKIQKLQRGKACRQQVSVERQQKEAAARRIQSLERGRQCRQQLEEDKRRQKEDAAAMKIQKIQRGNASRKQDQRKLEAATRIQSLERGRQCRQQLAQEKKQKQEQEDAAVKIQKIQRGKVARKVAETEREVRRKEEKAKRLCFPKRGAAPGAAVREVPPKTGTMAAGKSSRLRTYQLCHAEAKRQAQPKQSQADRVRQEPIGRSVTPGRSRHIRNTVGVSGQTPRSMTPGRVATKPPAKTPVTQIPKSAPQVAANQAGRASRSTTPAGRKNPVKAAMQSRQSPFNSDGPQSRAVHQISDFASSAQNLLGCRRVAAKLTEKRLESQQSKKELAEKQCAVACLIQACLKSGISRRRLEILHQKHVNAIKIQALFRGWRGRQLFRSRLKAQRALLDFDQQVQRSSILHRLETPTQPTQQVAKGVQRGAQEKKSASPVSPATGTPTTPTTPSSPGYQQLHRGKAPARTARAAMVTPKTRASSKSAPRRWM
eukprot:symbB.v1.2.033290.t1/scaffold4112.1/size45921/2